MPLPEATLTAPTLSADGWECPGRGRRCRNGAPRSAAPRAVSPSPAALSPRSRPAAGRRGSLPPGRARPRRSAPARSDGPSRRCRRHIENPQAWRQSRAALTGGHDLSRTSTWTMILTDSGFGEDVQRPCSPSVSRRLPEAHRALEHSSPMLRASLPPRRAQWRPRESVAQHVWPAAGQAVVPPDRTGPRFTLSRNQRPAPIASLAKIMDGVSRASRPPVSPR